MGRAKEELKAFLKSSGLYLPARRALRPLRLYRSSQETRAHRDRYLDFKRRHSAALGQPLAPLRKSRGIALVCSAHFPGVELELGVIKALELAGFTPLVLVRRQEWLLRKYYELASLREQVHNFYDYTEAPELEAAQLLLDRCATPEDLLDCTYRNARVGSHALATALRQEQVAELDLHTAADREILARYLARSMAAADGAARILQKFRPELAVLVDKIHSPQGELFDLCLANGVDCISWDLAHHGSNLRLKRFHPRNRGSSHDSMSAETWRRLRHMEFGNAHRQRLAEVLREDDPNREGQRAPGQQYSVAPEELREQLGLDPDRKTAIVFPCPATDPTLFWGGSLYPSHAQWLVATLRAAIENDRIEWIVKLPSAPLASVLRDGSPREAAELALIQTQLGTLPDHVILLGAESPISALSLLGITDYCVTVRHRLGIDAARRGIPVLTAGRGAYDRHGFTFDSGTQEQYLTRLADIDYIARLSGAARELAERFAYGYYLLRTLPMTSVRLSRHESREAGATRGRIAAQSADDWYAAWDVNVLAEWLGEARDEDFLMPDECEVWCPGKVIDEEHPLLEEEVPSVVSGKLGLARSLL